jgi:hypothetical protein
VKASAGRKVSEGLIRWAAGSAVMSDPTAAARFYAISTTLKSQKQSTHLLSKFDNFCRLSNSFLPEEDNARRLAGARRECSSILLFLDQLMPYRDVNLSSNALWHLVPVHVSARLRHGPDNLAETRGASNYICKGNGASFGNEGISAGLDEKVDEHGVGLVVRDKNRSEAVEGAGKEGSQELDAVGKINGNPLRAVVLEVLANDGNLLAYAVDLVLRDALLAVDGHDGRRAARGCASFEGNLAEDALPDIAEVAVLAGRVHWRARGLHGETGAEGIWRSALHSTTSEAPTAMGRLGRPEDGRLARLAHVRRLRLSRQQQRVRVGIGGVVDDPAQVADDAEGDDGSVCIPALEERGNGAVQLLEEACHAANKEWIA